MSISEAALRKTSNAYVDTPVRKDYSMTARHDYLTLNGSPYTLSMPTCPTLFLRKQRHWPVVWETQLDFQPDVPRVEAGTVLWWNHTCYASIGIALTDRDGRQQRVVKLTRPDMEIVEHVISEKGEMKLVIDSTATSYQHGPEARLRKHKCIKAYRLRATKLRY